MILLLLLFNLDLTLQPTYKCTQTGFKRGGVVLFSNLFRIAPLGGDSIIVIYVIFVYNHKHIIFVYTYIYCFILFTIGIYFDKDNNQNKVLIIIYS